MKYFAFIILAVFFFSCKSTSKSTAETAPKTDLVKEANYTTGTVIVKKLDGCSFLIKLEDGKHLIPLNLDESFKKDGLVIEFNYKPRKDVATVCMAGTPADILTVRKKK